MRGDVTFRSTAILFLSVFLSGLAALGQAGDQLVSGNVVDTSGAAVANAEVQVQSGGKAFAQHTDAKGHFAILTPLSAANVSLRVGAPGFESFSESVVPGTDLRITLRVQGSDTTVNVQSSTANRGGQYPLSDTPESVSVANAVLLQTQPAAPLDEKLRLLPGFATFRRADSRTANPSTQGVSMRGIGSSGASRALVLSEDFPLNDPFGGWVYWDRVAEAAIESVEVLRGGASHLYGSGAMGGVIQLRPSETPTGLQLNTAFSSRNSPFASASLAKAFGKFGVQVSGEGFRTSGYFLPSDSDRGSADTPASLRYGNGSARVSYAASEKLRMHAGSSWLSETRNNGTALQRNDTRLFDVTAGAEIAAGNGTVDVSGYGSGQRFNQTFSAIALDRESEALTRVDGVPSQQGGGSILWRGSAGRHNLIFGSDARQVRGSANGLVLATGTRSVLGGQQRTLGFFGQDRLQIGTRTILSGGVRVDTWRNFEGFTQVLAPQEGERTDLADRSDSAVSPHVALLFRLGREVSLSASAYTSFRAPTLQELYRGFRVGNVVTLANSDLQAERLTGTEVGISKRWNAATLRLTGFWNRVSDPIANITLSNTPQLITRQRQNLGATRAAGVEAEGTVAANRWLSLRAAYQFADSVVTDFPADVSLEGKRVPQVPRHTGSFAAIASARGWVASFQLRAAGVQFDDDQNQLPLANFASADIFFSRKLWSGVETYLRLEDIASNRYEVARTPVTTLGPPMSGAFGIRISLAR